MSTVLRWVTSTLAWVVVVGVSFPGGDLLNNTGAASVGPPVVVAARALAVAVLTVGALLASAIVARPSRRKDQS